jgi:hypothetical protein
MTEAKPFETRCPSCGADRVAGERFCPSCGRDLFAMAPETGPASKGLGPPPAGRRRSIGLTIVLALIFPGLGHLYAGRWRRGLAIMVGFILVLLAAIAVVGLLGASVVGLVCVPLVIVLGLLLFVPFELWQIIDAMASSAAANSGRA